MASGSTPFSLLGFFFPTLLHLPPPFFQNKEQRRKISKAEVERNLTKEEKERSEEPENQVYNIQSNNTEIKITSTTIQTGEIQHKNSTHRCNMQLRLNNPRSLWPSPPACPRRRAAPAWPCQTARPAPRTRRRRDSSPPPSRARPRVPPPARPPPPGLQPAARLCLDARSGRAAARRAVTPARARRTAPPPEAAVE
ncbi:unnamed protein product [Urochloa humidicola]